MSNGFDFSLAATRPALMSGNDNTVDVLIRLQAPDAPKTGLPERQPLNLAIVIDRSGSMEGRPLHEAKRAAAFMIDGMKPTDRASIVAYDDSVRVVAESRPVEGKAHFKRAISSIHSGGSTNLHGGWLKGAEEAAAHLSPGCTSRVLLLSDGQANVGLTDLDEIATQCAQLADKGVSTSTYGLGNSFNEELMVTMSRSGRGNGYYSETAESLVERFQEEFSLLSALCARNVRLFLSPLPGISCEMLNLYEQAKDGSWRLPDLAYDGEVWAAVRLYVESESLPPIGESLAFLRAHAAYVDLEGAECQVPEVWLTLPVLEKEKYLAIAENQDARRRVIEAEASRVQESASRAARNGDWNQVQRLMDRARDMARHSPWLGEIVANLETLAEKQDRELFSKEAAFTSMHLSNRQRSKREFDPRFVDRSAPAFLQRKVRQGGTGHYGSQVDSSDWAYVVSLGGTVPAGWQISTIEIVEQRRRYFHKIGPTWPTTPPNYIAFRYHGKLQSIHHVDGYSDFDNPHGEFPELPNENWGPHRLYRLGEPFAPPHEVKTGNIFSSGRVWCRLDCLFIAQTISEARDLSGRHV